MDVKLRGGGNLNGFYADFHFDYCNENAFYKRCYREGDDLGVTCYNEVTRLLDEYGVKDSYNVVDLENPINYGFEVYIEGELVTSLTSIPSEGIYLRATEGEYDFVLIFSTGALNYEY